MFKVRQYFSQKSEDTKRNRWVNSSNNSAGETHTKNLNSFIGKLKSKKIILMIFLAITTFMIIPVIPILLAFLAGRWLNFKGDKSLKKVNV